MRSFFTDPSVILLILAAISYAVFYFVRLTYLRLYDAPYDRNAPPGFYIAKSKKLDRYLSIEMVAFGIALALPLFAVVAFFWVHASITFHF